MQPNYATGCDHEVKLGLIQIKVIWDMSRIFGMRYMPL